MISNLPSHDRARFAVSAVFFTNGAALGGVAPYFPVIRDTLHLSSQQLGNALLFSPLAAILTLPFLGKAIHRFGSRKIAAVIGVLLCLTMIGIVSAPNVLMLRGFFFLSGLMNANMDGSMNTQAIAVQDLYRKPIVSSVHGWFSIGGFVGAAGVAVSTALHVASALNMEIAAVALIGLLLYSYRFLIPDSAVPAEDEPGFAFPKGPLVPIAALLMIAFLTEGAAWDWSAVFLHNSLGTSASLAAVGFGTFSVAMAGSRFGGDALVHRFGNLAVLQWASVLSTVGMLLAVATTLPPVSIAGFALMGLGIANVVPILYRAAGSVEGVPAGIGIASVSTCGYSMFLIAPSSIGYVADRVSLAVALGGAGLLVLIVSAAARSALKQTTL